LSNLRPRYPLTSSLAVIRPLRSSSCTRLQPLSGEAQVAQVHSCAAPVSAGLQVGHPRRPTCNRSSDGAPGSRVQHVQVQRYCGCVDATFASCASSGHVGLGMLGTRAAHELRRSRAPAFPFFCSCHPFHVHARHTQQLAEATAATHPSPDANPSRSQAHDNTYLSYSRNAIISTVAGGALVRQHARTRNLWCSSTP